MRGDECVVARHELPDFAILDARLGRFLEERLETAVSLAALNHTVLVDEESSDLHLQAAIRRTYYMDSNKEIHEYLFIGKVFFILFFVLLEKKSYRSIDRS